MRSRVVGRMDRPRRSWGPARALLYALCLVVLLGSLFVPLAYALPATGVTASSGTSFPVAATAEFPVALANEVPVTPADGFPVTLTDDLGRTLTLARPPQRIVSLAPSNTEILFAIGAGPQVVGVTDFCDYPPEVKNRPRVGGMVPGSLSVERVVSLRPDLVLSVGNLQRPIIDSLERLGIQVFAVDSSSLEHLYENVRKVGRLTGHPEGAEAVVEAMRRRVEAVRRRVADIPPHQRLRVFYEVWDNPLMTAGPRTFIGQLIELAGGVNVFGDVGQQWPQVSMEELVRRDPDVILGPATHGSALVLDQLRRRPGWQNLRAVRTGRVHVVEDNLISRPGPRLVDGLELVARALYPERFAAPEPAQAPRPGAYAGAHGGP